MNSKDINRTTIRHTGRTTRKLIAGIALAAGLAGLGAGAAGAQTTQPAAVTSSAQHGPGRGHRGGPGAMHAEVLGSLVKAGTITQAKADAIVKAFEAARPAKPAAGSTATPSANRPDPATAHKAVLDSLVKAGTITQTEADAVQKAFEAARPQGMPPVRGARGAVSSTRTS